jgi:hypothetical protein
MQRVGSIDCCRRKEWGGGRGHGSARNASDEEETPKRDEEETPKSEVPVLPPSCCTLKWNRLTHFALRRKERFSELRYTLQAEMIPCNYEMACSIPPRFPFLVHWNAHVPQTPSLIL